MDILTQLIGNINDVILTYILIILNSATFLYPIIF